MSDDTSYKHWHRETDARRIVWQALDKMDAGANVLSREVLEDLQRIIDALAIACRYRVDEDDPRTRLGLPEVKLVIHPGFGGTLRLPPLVGAPAAMDLILPGRTVAARAAQRMGLVANAVP